MRRFAAASRLEGLLGLLGAVAYWGFDIARDVVITDWNSGSGYTLDGYGGVHQFGANPVPTGFTYWPYWDIAVTLKVDPASKKGYTLDAFGGVHAFNGAPAVTTTNYWQDQYIARDMIITDFNVGKGYVIDGSGGWWPFGGAPAVTNAPSF